MKILFESTITNVGYHAGDLGKAEFLNQQAYSRGTGHFGTGTYFVGSREKLEKDSYYGKRPIHVVDFTPYKLFRIRNTSQGYSLHDALKVIDGGLDERFVNRIVQDSSYIAPVFLFDREDVLSLGDKYGWNTKGMIQVYTQQLNNRHYNYLPYDEWKKQAESKDSDIFIDFEGEPYTEDEILEYYEEYLKSLLKDTEESDNSQYSKFRDAYNKLTMIFNTDAVKKALLTVLDYQSKTNRMSKTDSYATIFMKSLGYDGIDVRGTDLDNTTYGSVIYDVKSNTILEVFHETTI